MDRLTLNASKLLDDMRYVNDVLDEASHLGLSDESAERIKTVVQHRITELEAEVSESVRSDLRDRQSLHRSRLAG